MIDATKLLSDYDGRAIVTYDIVPKLEPLLKSGYIVRNDGKIAPAVRTKSIDAPWIYVRPHPTMNCTLSTIMFSHLGIFPQDCLRCWKVVVRPRNIKELLMLLEVEENLIDKPCKCGIEVRDYVPAHYGGYFYNRDKEEGLNRLDEIRKLVSDNISPDIPVFLKRACTELELAFGDSNEFEDTLMRGYFTHKDRGKVKIMPIGDMQIWQRAADQLFDMQPEHVPQPPFVRQHIIRKWFEFAWSINDMTVKEFFGGEPLYTPAVKYERD